MIWKMGGRVATFATGDKLFRAVKRQANCEDLHRNFMIQKDWAINVEKKLSINKCKATHVEREL